MYDVARKAIRERRRKADQDMQDKPLYGYRCIHHNKYFCIDVKNRPCDTCRNRRIWDS